MDELKTLLKLAGVQSIDAADSGGGKILSGNEKAEIMRQKCIKPGSKEWFRLWFSKPGLTGEKQFPV